MGGTRPLLKDLLRAREQVLHPNAVNKVRDATRREHKSD